MIAEDERYAAAWKEPFAEVVFLLTPRASDMYVKQVELKRSRCSPLEPTSTRYDKTRRSGSNGMVEQECADCLGGKL